MRIQLLNWTKRKDVNDSEKVNDNGCVRSSSELFDEVTVTLKEIEFNLNNQFVLIFNII